MRIMHWRRWAASSRPSTPMADLDGKRYDLYSAHASGGLFRFRWRFEIAACRTNPGIKKHDARGKTERKPPASALAHAWCTAPPCGGDGNDSLRRIRQMLQRIATGSQMLQRTATGRRQGGGQGTPASFTIWSFTNTSSTGHDICMKK